MKPNYILSVFLCLFLVGCDDDDNMTPSAFEPTEVPSTIEDLYEVRGDASSDTVIVFLQGGPTTMRSYGIESDDTFVYPYFDDKLKVYPFQVQHLNESFKRATDYTLETAKTENMKTVRITRDVVEHFKDQGKVVYLMGHSFGAFICQEVLAEFGQIATKTVVMNGRLNMDEDVIQAFSEGRTWRFDENGQNPSLFDENEDSREQMNMTITAAGLGFNRYVDELSSTPIGDVIFFNSERDQNVGTWSQTEIDFLIDRVTREGTVALSSEEGNHSSVFAPDLMQQVYSIMIE